MTAQHPLTGDSPPEEWREWADASIEWSRKRRSRDAIDRQRSKHLDRALLAMAVIGLLLMIVWIQEPFPIEQWYYGILAVILMVPWMTRRIS